MRNRNIMVLLGAMLLIVAVLLLSLIPQGKREITVGATVVPAATQAPSASPEAAQETADTGTAETQTPANAYLLVTVAGTVYEPVALCDEGEYTLRRGDEYENVIHVTPDSIYMKSSSCDNQDCVLQGTVTLENMDERVLGNMIICLPNEVTLELHTPEGLAELLMNYGQ